MAQLADHSHVCCSERIGIQDEGVSDLYTVVAVSSRVCLGKNSTFTC